MSWKDYLELHAEGRTNVELAKLASVSPPQVGKWRRGVGGVDAVTVIAFARAVGDKPLNALVEAGFLTPEEARQRPAGKFNPSELSNKQLLDLVAARMSEGRDGDADAAPTSNVTHLPAAGVDDAVPPDLDAAARRTGRKSRVQLERERQDQDSGE